MDNHNEHFLSKLKILLKKGKTSSTFNQDENNLINSIKKEKDLKPLNKNEKKEVLIFPKGSEYEKELNLNFKYFNIFWFDPNNSLDFNKYKTCFKNVNTFQGFDLESTLKFFEKTSSLEEWILLIISNEEELISKLHQNQSINAFFIYCLKPELLEKLVKKYEKIKCVTNDPIILIKAFININKDYLIPNFIYEGDENKKKIDLSLNFNNLKSENKFALKSVLRENDDFNKSIKNNPNTYNIFNIKLIKYLKDKNCLDDLKEILKDKNAKLYFFAENLNPEKEEGKLKKLIKFLENITLISLYFNEYPYLFNLFTNKELKDLLIDEIPTKTISQLYHEKVYSISEKLYEKLNKNESILNEKNDLKQIQTFAILFSLFFILKKNKNILDCYRLIECLRDVDFSLKLFLNIIHLHYFNKKDNTNNCELLAYTNNDDKRILTNFIPYLQESNKLSIPSLDKKTEEDKDESLTIKDFLIIGDENFNKKIKNIEKNMNFKTIKYLKIDEISNYIKNKNNIDSNKEDDSITFFYFLIINEEDFQKNYDKIILLSAEFGLTFIVLIFIENEKETLFNKIFIKTNFLLTIILVYSIEDIISYLGKKINFNFEEAFMEDIENEKNYIKFFKIPIPKIIFNDNSEDCQNGCFELAETFDINLVKGKYYSIINNALEIDPIYVNLYLLYKDNDCLNLYYKNFIKYLDCSIERDIVNLDISTIKRILYLYCREETESKKSLYYMLNSDLRSRDPAKIYRYLDLIAYINKLIENGELANYKGKVYRATKLDENLILKLKEGSTMVNTTFWSTSKDYNVANSFLEDQTWRNSFIICEAIKNNIDIDFENLNYFAEKEILYLPFNEFKIIKISSEIKFNRKIYIIELTELGSKNSVNFENMNTINLDADYMKNAINYWYNKGTDKEKENENKEENEKEKEIKDVKESENKEDNKINERKKVENKNRKEKKEEKRIERKKK